MTSWVSQFMTIQQFEQRVTYKDIIKVLLIIGELAELVIRHYIQVKKSTVCKKVEVYAITDYIFKSISLYEHK